MESLLLIFESLKFYRPSKDKNVFVNKRRGWEFRFSDWPSIFEAGGGEKSRNKKEVYLSIHLFLLFLLDLNQGPSD